MSTSDQDQAAGFAERLPALPVDETSLVGLLPDVAMLSRMANEFFRAQPGQGSPTTVAPLMPNAQDLTPSFETRLPQFGMPLPSVPAIPSAGSVPVATDVSGLSSAPTELSPYMMGPAAAVSLPAAAPGPQMGVWQQDPRTAVGGVSPFSVPMPQFGATSPSFETSVPGLPPFSPLLTEDDAKSALTATSPFYFLEHAGGLSGSGMAPAIQPVATAPMPQYDPRSAAAGLPSSPFSLPMPEFDRALFPSFAAGVPTLAPLSPLLNEDDARAALTESSSLYFLEDSGLLTASDKAQKNASVPEPKSAMSHPAAVG